MKVDLCVIGGGLSGTLSAVHAASKGKRVVLVRSGWGGTALSCGAFDVADTSYEGFEISDQIEQIKKEYPHHPYHHLNFGNLSPSVELLKKVFPFRILGSYRENHLFLSHMGHWLRRAFAMESQSFDFKVSGRRKALVIGFSPMIPAPLLQSELCISESIPWHRNEVNLLPQTMAKFLDRPEELQNLAKHIKSKIKSHFFQALLVPPVMGLDYFSERRRELESLMGCPVYETLGGGNSVPGIRFQKGLEEALRSQNITVVNGRAERVEKERKRALAIKGRKHGGEPFEIEASFFVLAAGKFLTGGIRKNRLFQEPLFHLPLFYRGTPVSEMSPGSLLRDDFFEKQPFLEVGVKTNHELLPLDDSGEIVYENLRVCGTLLYGFDPYGGESRFGVSMLSGYQAGGA
ncbi:MAG: FAD-binding protein [Deltaproteobacteria bacterium]